MPDIDSLRKPLHRFWLFAPFVALIVIIVTWSVAWIAIRAAVASRMDAAAERLRGEGWSVDWAKRSIAGYPFRIEVSLARPNIAEPSGWGLAASNVEMIANAYDLGHWVAAAPPTGIVLARPGRGSVAITGQFIRGSLVTADGPPPRILIEAAKVVIVPLAGAKPLPIDAADHVQLGLRSAPDDRGQAYVQIDGATAEPGGALAVMSGGRSLTISARSWLTRISTFAGRDWPSAARAWSAAGGAVELDQGEIAAGPTSASTQRAFVKVDDDGHLHGALPLNLRGGEAVVRALGQVHAIDPLAAETAVSVIDARAGGRASAKVDLGFEAGVTTLGPVAIAPAPRVY